MLIRAMSESHLESHQEQRPEPATPPPTPPLDQAPTAPPTGRAPLALVDAMRALQSALDHHDDAISEGQRLGRSDWRCLHHLVTRGPLSPSALQRALGLTSGSVTALLDRLEKRALIERRAHPSDRRALRIVALPEAQALVHEASDPLDQVTRKLTERWGAERSEAAGQACRDLAKLVEWSAQRV